MMVLVVVLHSYIEVYVTSRGIVSDDDNIWYNMIIYIHTIIVVIYNIVYVRIYHTCKKAKNEVRKPRSTKSGIIVTIVGYTSQLYIVDK